MTWTWAIGFAFFSAFIWLVAAAIPIQKSPFLEMGVGGGRPSPQLDAILSRLRLQSRLNAAAALSMAVSVFLQLNQL